MSYKSCVLNIVAHVWLISKKKIYAWQSKFKGKEMEVTKGLYLSRSKVEVSSETIIWRFKVQIFLFLFRCVKELNFEIFMHCALQIRPCLLVKGRRLCMSSFKVLCRIFRTLKSLMYPYKVQLDLYVTYIPYL